MNLGCGRCKWTKNNEWDGWICKNPEHSEKSKSAIYGEVNKYPYCEDLNKNLKCTKWERRIPIWEKIWNHIKKPHVHTWSEWKPYSIQGDPCNRRRDCTHPNCVLFEIETTDY